MTSKTDLRPGLVAVGAVVAMALFASGPAWACVPQPLVSVQPKASGAAGARVTVEALAVNGAAEIRWNGVDGALLAKATGPNFSMPITIPDDDQGLYAILVLERQADGSLGSAGRASFHITGSGPEGRASEGGRGSTTTVAAPARSTSSTGSAPLAAGAAGFLVGGVGAALLSGRRRRHA